MNFAERLQISLKIGRLLDSSGSKWLWAAYERL